MREEELERRLSLDFTKCEEQVREELEYYFNEITNDQMLRLE